MGKMMYSSPSTVAFLFIFRITIGRGVLAFRTLVLGAKIRGVSPWALGFGDVFCHRKHRNLDRASHEKSTE